MNSKQYRAVTAVWEVTMGCNMRCKHCGSSCTSSLSDELSTEEAFILIDQLTDVGLRWITLSGGEPLTRQDLPLLVRRLKDKGITVNVITNGWLLKENAKLLHDSGISTVAISIDGPCEIHDQVRMPGSYARSEAGFAELKRLGVITGAITTITKQNIGLLSELRDDLIRIGVDSWQIQIGLPMGNLRQRPDWVIDPSQVDDIIHFCYETMKEENIRIYPADCIGYYNNQELETRKVSYQSDNVVWDGCNAGVRGFGILHNGDILGCTSIRSREFIEGNIRENSLSDIWNGDDHFLWRRNITKERLDGICKNCTYGNKCLGGCPNTRLTMEGSIYGENKYCSYNNYLRDALQNLSQQTDIVALFSRARNYAIGENHQLAALSCDRILELDPEHLEAFKLKGFAEFMCGNYEQSENANRKAIAIFPEDAYALKGLALALHKQNKQMHEVLPLLEKADSLTHHADADIRHDMEIIKRNLRTRYYK